MNIRERKPIRLSGQSVLEYTVLIAAVTAALVIMGDYVRKSFSAHAKSVEIELNGGTDDNDGNSN